MEIGILIIGDEILSGKRKDQHLENIIKILFKRGLQLSWAEYIRDDQQKIVQTLKRTFKKDNIVFSCGGIGSTPDDLTRQSAAIALDLPLELHPEAREKIYERIKEAAIENNTKPDYFSDLNLHRLKMGEFPKGAKIIPNPFNKIPGFFFHHGKNRAHYFVPGFPIMAQPMISWALDTHHFKLFNKNKLVEKSVIVYNGIESRLTPLMEEIEKNFKGIKIFSLPSITKINKRRFVELGVKGELLIVEKAFLRMIKGLEALNEEFEQK